MAGDANTGDAKADWVLRVLGVQVGAAATARKSFDEAAFRRDFRGALQAWRDASAEVDEQINELRTVLLATDDKDLHRIAEVGLNGITGTRKVGLQTALREIAAASGPALIPLATKAVRAAEEFRGFVQSDARVKACDAYPKITTPIGPTLGRALGALAQALTV
jgi:hypothetical protein